MKVMENTRFTKALSRLVLILVILGVAAWLTSCSTSKGWQSRKFDRNQKRLVTASFGKPDRTPRGGSGQHRIKPLVKARWFTTRNEYGIRRP